MFSQLLEIFRHGGATLVVIIIASILALGVGLERWHFATQSRTRMRASTDRILAHLREKNVTMAQAVNSTLPLHPATEVFNLILKADTVRSAEIKRVQSRIVRSARRRLWILGSIGAVAPFVGLFGTVLGVMAAFHQIGIEGAGGYQVVSGGISEALITTAAGIFVGVEAVVLFNYLQVQLAEYAAELRESVEEILETAGEVAHGSSSSHA